MKNLFIVLLTATLFFCATSAMATSFYYEASDVVGYGLVSYDNPFDMVLDPTTFSFTGLEGDTDSNLYAEPFVPGYYEVSFNFTNLWINNEEPVSTFPLINFGMTFEPFYIPELSLVGSYGPLSWNFDPTSSLFLMLDYNPVVSAILFGMDPDRNGAMDAYIGWDSFRVDVAPVPEPSTFILLGAGIAGLAFYRRKKS